MIKIKDVADNYYVEPVNGVISNNTIIIGKKGKKIDVDASYEKMKKIKKYNKDLLEYISIKPSISMNNNYDKLIIGSNTNDKRIAFVFKTNNINYIKQIIYIANRNDVSIVFYVDGQIVEKNYSFFRSIINNKISLGIYGYNNVFNNNSVKYVNDFYKNSNFISNYCLYKDSSFLKSCKYYKIGTIKPIPINNNLYNYIKENKTNGYIYEVLVNKNNIRQLNSTFTFLKQKGYSVEKIDVLLKE